jgi:hypothetical protein
VSVCQQSTYHDAPECFFAAILAPAQHNEGLGVSRMAKKRRATVALAACAVAAISGSCARSQTPVSTSTSGANSCSSATSALCAVNGNPLGTNVLAAAMIDPSSGWVLTASGLSVTRDNGRSWRSAEPPGVAAADVLTVQFADAADGWVVSSSDGVRLTLDRTNDGALTWTHMPLPNGSGSQLVEAAYSYFAGSQGWIVVGRGASASTETGTVYVTNDAQHSFVTAPIPAVTRTTFLSSQDWFMPGGSGASSVYATQTGGAVWHRVRLPLPSGASSTIIDAISPDQTSRESNLLAVTLPRPHASGLDGFAVFTTKNGAASFTLNGDVAFGVTSVGTMVVSIPDSSDVIAMADQSNPSGVATYSSSDAGIHFDRTVALAQAGQAALADATQVKSASFVNTQVGWALALFKACFSNGPDGPADCHSIELLFATEDGGSSWSALSAP